MFSQTTPPTMSTIRSPRAISRRRPPRRPGCGLAATVAMLPGKDSSSVAGFLAPKGPPRNQGEASDFVGILAVPFHDHDVVPTGGARVHAVDGEILGDGADRG